VHADAYDGYNAVHNNIRHLGCWMHARRYFVEAEPSDPRAVEALAFIRTLYAVEREIKVERDKLGETLTDADVVRLRQARAGPILAKFSDWLEDQRRHATPKSLFGQAIEYSRNQWSSLVRYLNDARFAIDIGASERAIRPFAIGRANWLQIGGDGGLKTASSASSGCAVASPDAAAPAGNATWHTIASGERTAGFVSSTSAAPPWHRSRPLVKPAGASAGNFFLGQGGAA